MLWQKEFCEKVTNYLDQINTKASHSQLRELLCRTWHTSTPHMKGHFTWIGLSMVYLMSIFGHLTLAPSNQNSAYTPNSLSLFVVVHTAFRTEESITSRTTLYTDGRQATPRRCCLAWHDIVSIRLKQLIILSVLKPSEDNMLHKWKAKMITKKLYSLYKISH